MGVMMSDRGVQLAKAQNPEKALLVDGTEARGSGEGGGKAGKDKDYGRRGLRMPRSGIWTLSYCNAKPQDISSTGERHARMYTKTVKAGYRTV